MPSTLADRNGNLLAPYATFSGTDIIASIVLPGSAPIVLGEVSTFSYSIYREKAPVRTLGRINVRGFAKGQRTVAGTIIFTVFDRHVVNSLRAQLDVLRQAGRLKSDELPPFDILLVGGNEFGSAAAMRLYGVTVIEEGMTLSVEDIFSENIWQYQARDIRLLDNDIAEGGSDLVEPSRSQFRDGADMALGFFQPENLAMAKAALEYQDAVRNMLLQRLAEKQALEDRVAGEDAVRESSLDEKRRQMSEKQLADRMTELEKLNKTLDLTEPPRTEFHYHFVLELWGDDGQKITSGITDVILDHSVGDSTRSGISLPSWQQQLEQFNGTNQWYVKNAWLQNIPAPGNIRDKPKLLFKVDQNAGMARNYDIPVSYEEWLNLPENPYPVYTHKLTFKKKVPAVKGYSYDRVEYAVGPYDHPAGKPFAPLSLDIWPKWDEQDKYPVGYWVTWFLAYVQQPSGVLTQPEYIGGGKQLGLYDHFVVSDTLDKSPTFQRLLQIPGSQIIVTAALFKPDADRTKIQNALERWNFNIRIQ